MTAPLTFILAGTLDTKGKETGYCRELFAARGHRALVIDMGILGAPEIAADIDRHAVARAAGTDIEAILARGSKNDAILTMRKGLAVIARELVASGKAHGILGLGGGQGTVMMTSVMRELPFGFPKVMVSVIANGGQTFGPLVGTSDIAIIHSVADILGLNAITRRVLAEGVGALIGMAEIGGEDAVSTSVAVGLTAAGVTTPAAMKIRELLEAQGIEVITFHCNGVGAQAMENLVAEGRIQGVIDLSPKDVSDGLYGGIFPAYPERYRPIREASIPCIVVPGTLDFILYGPVDTVPSERKARKFVIHNPLHTHVRADYAEMKATGRWITDRLVGGPLAVIVPTRGFTQLNRENGPMFDPQADAGFAAGVREFLDEKPDSQASIETFDLHINDPEFACAVAERMTRMLAQRNIK
jgi:uncharacterized protein (UPF0261 family)